MYELTFITGGEVDGGGVIGRKAAEGETTVQVSVSTSVST